jgi:hypothetical protein
MSLSGRGLIQESHRSPVFPARAGIQIHPERLVGFTWAPAFAGETGKGPWFNARRQALDRHVVDQPRLA